MKHVIAQWREETSRNEFGKVVNRRCNCSNKISGLDATGCRHCQMNKCDRPYSHRQIDRTNSPHNRRQH